MKEIAQRLLKIKEPNQYTNFDCDKEIQDVQMIGIKRYSKNIISAEQRRQLTVLADVNGLVSYSELDTDNEQIFVISKSQQNQ